MGTDNLFHKRKARQVRSHLRKVAKRAPYERILIVCEGEKTEPLYFMGLRRKFGLNPANVVIAHKKNGLDPKSLVDYALEEFRRDSDFNHVFCVFDRDKHATFHAALNKIADTGLKGGAKLHAITSVPCFEVWILLHFGYTTRPFQAGGNNSNCALVVAELRKGGRIPGYEKGSANVFAVIEDKIEAAVVHAKRLAKFHETSGTDNPSTQVHELVEHLRLLRRD